MHQCQLCHTWLVASWQDSSMKANSLAEKVHGWLLSIGCMDVNFVHLQLQCSLNNFSYCSNLVIKTRPTCMHGRGTLFPQPKLSSCHITEITAPPCIVDITCASATCFMLHAINIVVQCDVLVMCYMFMYVQCSMYVGFMLYVTLHHIYCVM